MKSEPLSLAGASKRGPIICLSVLLVALSCGNTREDPTGGETHFLTRCDDANARACGGDLSCVCGVCTLPCSGRAECTGFPVAECVQSSQSGCTDAAAIGHCDVPCVGDADCSVLSSLHRCAAGACRADPPGSTGTAGAASDAGSAGSAGMMSSCPRGEVEANQVLLIGDSFFASSHQVTAFLEDLARGAGALEPGERYRDNSRLTGNALALGGNGILDQYSAAAEEAKVEVVIMNGGGADVLLGACEVPDASCPTLTAATAAASDLFARLAEDDVRHVIYAFYPDPIDAAVRARMDAFRPLAEAACAESAVLCEWLDLRETFADNYASYVQSDGLNPTASGSRASASAIWSVMQTRCIAQ